MRWHQLNESNEPSIEDIPAFIKKNCRPYLSQYRDWKNNPMYRGVSVDADTIVKPIRTDRRPLDTNQFLHTIYDNALKQAGFTATRSNSIFCTGDSDQADGYGQIYVIFPIGNFSYTWSPEYPDLTYELGTIAENGGFGFNNVDKDVLTLSVSDFLPEELEKLKGMGIPEKFSFNYLIEHVLPKIGYTLVQWLRTVNQPWIFKKLGFDPNALAAHFKETFSDTDITDAIESHTEIMIAGSSYLGIRNSVFNEIKDKIG